MNLERIFRLRGKEVKSDEIAFIRSRIFTNGKLQETGIDLTDNEGVVLYSDGSFIKTSLRDFTQRNEIIEERADLFVFFFNGTLYFSQGYRDGYWGQETGQRNCLDNRVVCLNEDKGEPSAFTISFSTPNSKKEYTFAQGRSMKEIFKSIKALDDELIATQSKFN